MIRNMITDFIKAMETLVMEGKKPKNAFCFYLIIFSLVFSVSSNYHSFINSLFIYVMTITHLLSTYYTLGIVLNSEDAKIYEKLFLPLKLMIKGPLITYLCFVF